MKNLLPARIVYRVFQSLSGLSLNLVQSDESREFEFFRIDHLPLVVNVRSAQAAARAALLREELPTETFLRQSACFSAFQRERLGPSAATRMSLATGLESRVIILEEQYWRIGPYLVEDNSLEEVEKDVWIPFIHRPLSRYVNAMAAAGLATSPGWRSRPLPRVSLLGPRSTGMPPPSPACSSCGPRSWPDRPPCTIPTGWQPARGAECRTMAEFLIITGMSGAGRSQAGGHPRGPRVVRDRQHADRPDHQGRRAGRRPRLDHRPGGPRRRSGRRAARASWRAAVHQLRASGSVVRTLFLEASDEVLVRRFEGTRRRHPLGQEGVTEAIALERKRLRADPGPGRRHRRHHRPQRQPAAGAAHRPLHSRPGRAHADLGHVVRLQARRPARRRQRVRRALPAQPALDRRAAAPDRAGRAGAQTTCWTSRTPGSSCAGSTTCSASCSRRTSRKGSRT